MSVRTVSCRRVCRTPSKTLSLIVDLEQKGLRSADGVHFTDEAMGVQRGSDMPKVTQWQKQTLNPLGLTWGSSARSSPKGMEAPLANSGLIWIVVTGSQNRQTPNSFCPNLANSVKIGI